MPDLDFNIGNVKDHFFLQYFLRFLCTELPVKNLIHITHSNPESHLQLGKGKTVGLLLLL